MKINQQSGKVCVAIAAESTAKAIALARTAEAHADVIEIRLDALTSPEVKPFIEAITTPLLFTNRAQWEGGSFTGSEEERLDLLHQAIEAGAAFVDIELKTAASLQSELLHKAHQRNIQTIVSWHNFSSTPSQQGLRSILQDQYKTGAKIGKIITMANSPYDVLRVLSLLAEADEIGFPLIAFCMGPLGVVSRVATTELGGYMTYAAADSSSGTAPGQLAISSLKTIQELLHGI
jgi:3-dehydroquinate dehydratase-1/3-dehydroquinate dehydratase/shikimate dehydrogenase